MSDLKIFERRGGPQLARYLPTTGLKDGSKFVLQPDGGCLYRDEIPKRFITFCVLILVS